MKKWYALYRGDNILMVGSMKQIANYLGISEKGASFYSTPAWRRRVNTEVAVYIIKIEEEDEDE